jgi:hypothetical protein
MDSGSRWWGVLIAEVVTMQPYERHTLSGGRSSRAQRTSTRPGYKRSLSAPVIRARPSPNRPRSRSPGSVSGHRISLTSAQ